MSNDISKRYSFTIDTKDSKTLNNGLSFNHGDDITLIIKIIEDSQPKLLTNCSVDLIIANQSQEFPIIHRYSDGGITILDDTVTIITKSNYINLIGVNVAQLLISDEDQTITTQPFAFTTISTLLSDDMVGAVDKIDTLVELDKVIEETRSKITLVDGEITRLSQMASTVKNDVESLSESLTNKVQTVITNTDSIVSGVIRDEEQRKLNENTRITSEQERARNEQARRDAEIQRNNRENTRISSENERLASERDRVSAEISRSTSEISRNSAENKRDNAETQRVTNESSRILAETDRFSAETQRVTNETSREKAETARSSAETTRLQNENSRFTAEKNRIAAETERIDNETSRKTAESNRVSAETTRSNNETARSTAETKRQQSEALRVAAESDRASRFEAMNKVYEASAGEVEDNRKDYNGVIHSTMYEARKSDYETLDNKFGDFTHSTYDESNIMSIKNTKDGLIKNIIVKGKTLHNLTETIQGNGSVNKQYSSIATSNLLIPGRLYTLIVKNSTNEDVSLYCNSKRLEYKGFVVSKNSTLSLTTIAVTNFNPDDATFLSLSKDQTLIQNLDIILLEGDHTEIDIQSFQGITSIGEDGSLDIITCGKNLIDMKYIIPQTTNGVTISNDDGRIYLNGTSTGYIDIYFAGIHNTLYSRATELRRFLVGNTKTFTLSNNLNLQNFFFKSNNEYPLTTANKTVACFVRIIPGKTFQNDELLVQLEEGGVSTSYESHVCDKITIFLNEPLRRLSDTIYDEIDISNGMIIRRIGKTIFNGSEHWTINGSVDRGVTSIEFVNTQHKGLSSGVCISNRFPYRLYFVDGNTSICCSEHGTYVVIKKSQLSELTPVGFTKWLADNPITLYYPLKTPIIEPIKRETLKAYDDITTMYVDTYYKPEISADFPIDTISEIEKNRIDFNGQHHNSMFEARMSDVKYILDRRDNTSFIDYESDYIIATNTCSSLINDITIKGNMLRNLIDGNIKRTDYFDIASESYVRISDGMIIASADGNYRNVFLKNSPMFKPDTIYTVCVEVINNTMNEKFQINADPDGILGKSIFNETVYIPAFATGVYKFKLTTRSVIDDRPVSLRSFVPKEATTGSIKFKYAIVEGDYTKHDFLTFNGVSTVGDKGYIEIVSCGKNLLNLDANDGVTTYEHDNAKFEYDPLTKKFTASGVPTSTLKYRGVLYSNDRFVKLKPSERYTFSANINLPFTIQISERSVAAMSTLYKDTRNSGFYNTINKGNYLMIWDANQDVDLNNLKFGLQIEHGNVDTEYEPYKESVIRINLKEPIRRVSDRVYDEINIKDKIIIRRIGVKKVDQNMTWNMNGAWSTGDICHFYTVFGSDIPNMVCDSICDKFIEATKTLPTTIDNYRFGVRTTDNVFLLYINIAKSKLQEPNVEGFKKWLSTNPVNLYYELPTPIIESIELDNEYLHSYDNITNIFSRGSNVNPNISTTVLTNVQAAMSSLMRTNETLNDEISIMKATTDEKEMQNIEINLDQDLRLTMLELGVM